MKIKCKLIKHISNTITFEYEPGHIISQYFSNKLDKFFNIDIKLWKPKRTITQNSFFHLVCTELAQKLDMNMELIKAAIKEKYGYKFQYRDKLYPIPSSQCNKFEEFSALIEGCFIEAGEQGIDMKDFIIQWQKIKQARMKVIDK